MFVLTASHFLNVNLSSPESYEFGDVTKRVMSSIAEDVNNNQDQQMVAFQSSNTMEALDEWDRLSEKNLKDGIGEIEKYVESVQKEQQDESRKQ